MRSLAIAVPCFNEADSIPQLAEQLTQLERALGAEFTISELLFVDDGSSDDTARLLAATFSGDSRFRILRHERNRGLGAAIRTALVAATADIFCTIDADGTYHAAQLAGLLAQMAPEVDCVTASPYHPAGAVQNVPQWRLALSRSASRLYRCVMPTPLHTYTSCFRAYRRAAVAELPLREDGFLSVVELLWQLDRRGAVIVEAPATLAVRKFGQSKMRVVRVALRHLALLAQIAFARLFCAAPKSLNSAS